MTLTVRCKGCGYILYSDDFRIGRKYMISIPFEISRMHNGRCPKCGKELEIPSVEDIEVHPNPEFGLFGRRKDELM